jgi:DNA-binding NtrC family response regulator
MTPKRDPATDAFRLDAVDYLLKPLDPDQVTEAVNRLLAYLRPFEAGSFPSSGDHANGRSTGAANQLLPVKDTDREGPRRCLTQQPILSVQFLQTEE